MHKHTSEVELQSICAGKCQATDNRRLFGTLVDQASNQTLLVSYAASICM
jgi:hypothetical protein